MSHGDQGPQPPLMGQASFWQALVSRALPSHGFPFIWGLGELQSRILVITPSPHVTEQDDHGDQWLQPPSCLNLLSHSWMWQVRVCTEEPSHLLLRLSQERPRCWIPLPQVTEQEVHSDHGDQPSSAESLGQHRGQHSPSGTVALEQGMMGQDTFLQMVTEFWQRHSVQLSTVHSSPVLYCTPLW